ncbi:MAG: precorrin-8X methylmutase [Rhodospirillales bacterium]|nr:precorrin-8X methylmutase [Rhodospirillales bacterium]
MTVFDAYVVVDWSANATPKLGADSIWYAALVREKGRLQPIKLRNVRTRAEAKDELGELLAGFVAARKATLIGFDFPLGYPKTVAGALGLKGAPWRAVWNHLAREIKDSPNNRNNRFDVAKALNKKLSGEAFPFWGCHDNQVGPFLVARGRRPHNKDDVREHRLTDRSIKGPQPVWKLSGNGCVGGQALVGIPVVRSLRDDPALAAASLVWPFETGLKVPGLRKAKRRIVFAEVYPTLIRPAVPPGEIKDRVQVCALARYFAKLDGEGMLASLFSGPPGLSRQQRRIVEREEGWILGAGAALSRPASHPSWPGRPKGESRPSTTSAKPKDVDARHKAGHDTIRNSDGFSYLKSPKAIYRRSFALVKAATDLSGVAKGDHPLALRLIHACGTPEIARDLAFSKDAVRAGRRALEAGAPILVDSMMVAAGITRARLPANNRVVCTLGRARVAGLARAQGTTRSAAAVDLWRPHLEGAVVAIGNAPTALFRLLELIQSGAGTPALILGFPVGFVGAAESKDTLIRSADGIPFITLRGRRGGSALAAAAVNALANASEGVP